MAGRPRGRRHAEPHLDTQPGQPLPELSELPELQAPAAPEPSALSVFVDSRWVGPARKAAQWLMSTWSPPVPSGLEERRASLQRPMIERIRDLVGWRQTQGMVRRRYDQRGLRVSPAASPEPGLATLKALDGRRLVGTLSVRLDGPNGLAADYSFPDELLRLRAKGRKLVEFSKLAVEGAELSKPVLSGLYHMAYLYARDILAGDLIVMEVNPRHAPFYRRMLGAKRLEVGHNASVDAPSVLMCLDMGHVRTQIERFGGKPELADQVRCLYPYFYAATEEAEMLEMLRAEMSAE